MKGDTIYQIAQKLLNELYAGSLKTKVKKRELYNKYFYLLQKSAYLGNAVAQFEYGLEFEDVYYFGLNPKHNPKRSFYWYKKACENNVGSACNNLASYYESGIACKQDKEKALSLYKRASTLGEEIGEKNYKTLK